MRTLVTGSTGHLGRAVVALLQDEGHQVRLLRAGDTSTDVEGVQDDLGTSEGAVTDVAGAETVIHAATYSSAARRGGLRPLDVVRSPTDVDVSGTTMWAEWLRRFSAAIPLSRAA
jgi:nucleoside-diphosphate-sugar epimerase